MTISQENIDARADESVGLHHAYADYASRLSIPTSLRDGTAHDCLMLSLELHGSISVLVRFRHNAGAFALLRPLIETTLRAAWLIYVADFQSIERLVDNKNTIDLDRIARQLVAKSAHHELKSIAENILNNRHVYHSFAHAGLEQLARRRQGFQPNELIVGLQVADAFAVISGEMCSLLHQHDGLRRLTVTHGPRIARENYKTTGVGQEPPDWWDGTFPPAPTWDDPA